jgi:hypothetical protein
MRRVSPDLETGRVVGEVSIFVPELRYSGVMTEARDLPTDSHLEPDELVWLEERLVEYREMLEYLRLH